MSTAASFSLESAFLDELLRRVEAEHVTYLAASKYPTQSRLVRSQQPISSLSAPSNYLRRDHFGTLIHVAFWASLREDESRPLRFTISYVPQPYDYVFNFAPPLTFGIKQVASLAPAVGDEATMLVFHNDNLLEIWGLADFNPSLLAIKVLDPGRLIVSFGGANLAIIAGDESVFINPTLATRFTRLWSGLDQHSANSAIISARTEKVIETLKKMRSERVGGCLIVLPGSAGWEDSVTSVKYLAAPPMKNYHEIIDEWVTPEGKQDLGQQVARIKRMVRLFENVVEIPPGIARLSYVDGAVLITSELDVVGFGAKIKYDPNRTTLPPVYRVDCLSGGDAALSIVLSDLGGMRHQSAAFFISQNHNALALVASQDGGLSAFVWAEDTQIPGIVAYTQLEFALP